MAKKTPISEMSEEMIATCSEPGETYGITVVKLKDFKTK